MSIPERITPDKGDTTLLNHALAYSAIGWAIIPTKGKKAACNWKQYQKERPGPETVQRLFDQPNITGLAVITGKASAGLAIRDFDQPDAYHSWARANPEDAAVLPTVQTARGFHVYGRLAEEAFADLGDGELRADSGHITLLPPSFHPDGPIYTWLNPLPDSVILPLLPPSLTAERGEKTQQTQQHEQHIACVPVCVPAWAESAIALTLPSGPGQRNRKLFELALALKRMRPDASPEVLRQIVREWHRQALPFIHTKPFDPTWQDFITAWKRINRPGGVGLEDVVAQALDAPFPRAAGAYDTPDLQQLVAICAALQRAWGDRPFFLSVRGVKEVLGVSRMAASRMLGTLQFDGLLVLTKKGTFSSKDQAGSANEYLYRGDQPEG